MPPPVFNLMMNNEPLDQAQGQMRRLLCRLPDVPVSSNFTARVMQAIELEEKRHSRWHIFEWNWRVFVPRATVTAAVVVFASFGFHQHELAVHRQMLAKDVALITSQPVPGVDALNNFDTIQRMAQPARPDNELLALASDMK